MMKPVIRVRDLEYKKMLNEEIARNSELFLELQEAAAVNESFISDCVKSLRQQGMTMAYL